MVKFATTQLDEVAVTGYAVRTAGARNSREFWDVLDQARCTIGTVNPDRWATDSFLHPDAATPGTIYTPAAGQIDDVWDFDPGFFGISPREALQMDPQQRLLTEVVWEAMESAGLSRKRWDKGRTGVYIGASSSDYSSWFAGNPRAVDAQFMLGNTLSIMANRISYLFDLKGPSYTVDTACSSSFYALDQAMRAFREGEIDTAVVGAVNLLLSPLPFIGFSRAAMLSPDGLCRAFDSRANGYVRSEGAVVFVLRRMRSAHADGDIVRSIIATSGVNSDGRTIGMALPSAERQKALLESVSTSGPFDPNDLAFVEAHGTGTAVGDPLEATAIGETLGARRGQPLPVGSAKSNFGHLEPASGLIGLMKAQLSLENGLYPKTLHVEELNPNIPFDDLNLAVATEPVVIEDRNRPWFAAVNSFGFGGANASVLLRQPWSHETNIVPQMSPKVSALVLTAASQESLSKLASAWSEDLERASDVHAGLRVNNANHRRARHSHRLVALGGSGADLAAALEGYVAGDQSPLVVTGLARHDEAAAAFAYSGNGAQWVGMGRHLMATDATFRDAFAEVSDVIVRQGGPDLAAALEADDLDALLSQSTVAQPLLFAVQAALTGALSYAGVHPAATIGHSVGEVAAAHAAGALDLAQAAHLVRSRAVALEALQGLGGMAAVLAGAEALEEVLEAFGPHRLAIAADNSPRSTTLSGPLDDLDRFAKFARKRRIAVKRLDIDYPYHSEAVEAVREELHSSLAGLTPRRSDLPYYSSTRGALVPGEALDIDYWWENARGSVLFRPALEAMFADGISGVVEIGPRSVLRAYVTDTASGCAASAAFMHTMEMGAQEHRSTVDMAAEAITLGIAVDEDVLLGPEQPFVGDLPAYPWRHQTFRAERLPGAVSVFGTGPAHPLLGRRVRDDDLTWTSMVDPARLPWLADHVVDGNAVFPASGYLEIALAAGAEHFGHGRVELQDFDILKPIVFDGGAVVELRTTIEPAAAVLSIESRRLGGEAEWMLTARCSLRALPDGIDIPPAAAILKPRKVTEGAALYGALEGFSLAYGPEFARTERLFHATPTRARAVLTPCRMERVCLDPRSLDAALHGLFTLITEAADGPPPAGTTFLPVRVGRLRRTRLEGTIVGAELELLKLTPLGAAARVRLLDETGACLAALDDLRLKAVRLGRAVATRPDHWRTVQDPLPGVAARLPECWADPAQRLSALGIAADAGGPSDGALLSDILAHRIAWDAVASLATDGALTDAQISSLPDLGRTLLFRCLMALEARGGVRQEKGTWYLAETCPFPAIADLVALFLKSVPERADELATLLTLEQELPDRLATGEATPRKLNTVDLNAEARALWDHAATVLADLGTAPRILLLGATPQSVLDRLGDLPGHTTLVLSDESDAVVEMLAQTRERPARVEVASLEVALKSGPFDVILSVGAGERLRPGRLSTLASHVLETGSIIALEPAADLLTDLTLGQDPTWWHAHTVAAELPVGARLDQAGLEHVIQSAGIAEASVQTIGGLGLAVTCPGTAVATGQSASPSDAYRAEQRDGETESATLARWAMEIKALLDDEPETLHLSRSATDALADGLTGLRRVLANEYQKTALSFSIGDAALGATPEAAVIDGRTFTPRVEEMRHPSAAVGPESAVRLDLQHPGALDSLTWTTVERTPPAAEEVEIAVSATGLNFRDVMWAQGLLPEEALEDGFAGPTLGMECAGIVVRAGAGTDLRPGDRVIAFAPAAFASHVTVAANAVAPLPAGVALETAASIPTTFVTAHYGLVELARLEAGESVLIHGGAGGVGLAALQIAKARGATVYATAGTPARRALLTHLGADGVFDSRGLAFEADIDAATGGAGVDVVLNSLAGEAVERSLACLAPFGRFIELGKRDYYANSRIGLRPFRQNLSYFGVDADQLLTQKPQMAVRVFRALLDGFAADTYSALPCQIFEPSEVVDAFRLMQKSGHIGKVIVRAPEAPETVPPRTGVRDAWLVVGGLGGFGLATADWLAQQGARSVWLTGRSGQLAEADRRRLEARGVTVEVRAVDATDKGAMEALLEEIAEADVPLRGIVHAAMVLDDALMINQTADRLEAVLSPKVEGARHLDVLTRDHELDHFVLYSSVTTLFGNPGQAGYVAANAVLEGLATRRHAEGLPGLAVAWGPIGDQGYLARETAEREMLEKRLGAPLMTSAEALDELGVLLGGDEPVVAVARMKWGKLAADLPVVAAPLFDRVDLTQAATAGAAEGNLADLIAGLSDAEAVRLAT
ncbi:MAG: SDR family NAD(P)-dependent oxidoreductase, partial [Pseudomonadota bacterium]